MTETLSVVIVLYNSATVVADCLESIREEVSEGWVQVILVDNASPDTSLDVGLAAASSATVVRLDTNLGFAGGANAGIRVADGKYVLLLNPDVRVPPGALRELVEWMDRNPGIAAASPRLLNSDGADGFPGRALPSIWGTMLELSRMHRLLPPRIRGRLLQGPYWSGADQLDVGWIPGTAMLVRASAISAAGPLSEVFFMYGEDIEWCYRIRRRAGRIGVCSSVSFVHDWGSSSKLSWGEREAERRVIGGISFACEVMYGRAHARVIAALSALAALSEALMPGPSAAQRSYARESARNWAACVWRGPARSGQRRSDG